MVIYTKLKSIQKCGFAMITAANDQSDSFRNAHSGNGSFVWKIHGNTQTFGSGKRNGVLHWTGGNTAFPGEDGIVCDKGTEISFRQFMTDKILIFSEFDIVT